MDGVNSIIQSNGYVAGSTGWAIKGNGTAEFANTSIRGTITANAVTTTGLTIYSNGAVTTTSGKFGVTAGGVLSATEANIAGRIDASSGTMTGYLRAGDVYIGKNVYDASEHNGIGIDGSWNNAWVRRDTNDTTYFRVGSSSTYIQMDTGGTSAISFPNFSVDSSGNGSFQGTLTSGDGSIGGWNITSDRLYSGGIDLYSTGLIQSTLGNVTIKINVTNPFSAYVFEIIDNSTSEYVRSSPYLLSATSGGDFSFIGNNSIVTTGESTFNTGWVTGIGIAYPGCTTGPGTYNYMGLVWNNPDIRGTVDNSVSTVLGTVSDIRFKSEIGIVSDNIIEKFLKQIEVVEYRPIDVLNENKISNNKRIGIIAQSLKEIFPELVTSANEDDPEAFLSVNYLRNGAVSAKMYPKYFQRIRNTKK